MPKTLARISPERQVEIAALAEDIAITRFGGERVDPEEIARQEGIGFRYDIFPEEFDGILLHEAGRFYIVCNERRWQRGSMRSRFTFAHELGHYFLDDHRLALASGKWPAHLSLAEFVSDQPIEKESDCFAANLLMPATPFRRKAAELPSGIERISALSSVYGTSLTATGFRAIALDTFLAPAALFRWDRTGAKAGRWMSPTTYKMGRHFREMVSAPPADSETAKAVARRPDGTNVGSSHCRKWFPATEGVHFHDGDLLLREEIMSLGHYGWMTLVHKIEGQ